MKIKDRQHRDVFLGSCNRVSFGQEYNGKCSIKKCKKRKVFRMFIDDGAPKMSRYYGAYCEEHLRRAINIGWERNDKDWRKKKKND